MTSCSMQWILVIASVAGGLAAIQVAHGEEEHAAQLLGAAASLREHLETDLDDFEEQIHERTVANATAALGDEVFASAWARGHRMTPEEIVQLCSERSVVPQDDAAVRG